MRICAQFVTFNFVPSLSCTDNLLMPLYSLGSNSSFQLSLLHTEDVCTPSLTTLSLPPDESPVKIVAGSNHTLLLTNKGSLYASGANKYGQCLLPPCDVVHGFTRVEGIWWDCAATWEGSVAIREDETIWSFGNIRNHENLKGITVEAILKKYGIRNSNAVDGNYPREIVGCNVFGGVHHFIVLYSGEAVGFGDGKKGQFGTTTTNSNGTKLPMHHIVQISCGKDFTCALSKSGDIAVYTTNAKYNLTSIPSIPHIKQITASWSTIAVLDHSGHVTSWGRSDHGQFPPANLRPLTSLASGSEHFLGLSSTGDVFAWGWNEHGNCGAENRNDITRVHRIDLPEGEKARYVAGGCGTSWIWTERVEV